MRLMHSDAQLHQRLAPESPLQRLIFDLLEQLRVETMVNDRHPGIRNNLYRRFRDWSLRFHHDGHAETELGLLIYTIAQMAWSRLGGYPTLEETDDLIEVTRGRVSGVIGRQLAALRRERNNQADYAEQALSIARIVDDSLTPEGAEDSTSSRLDTEKALSRITLALDFSDDSEESNISTVVTGSSKVLAEQNQVYHVYSRDYDREYRAASQIREAELRQFREQLDAQIFHQGINVPRLARQISQLLAIPRRDGWLFGEEEGLIDGPPMFQLCLGIPHASPATPEVLSLMKGLLPEDANWSAFGISRMEFSIVAQAASQGGNCRVGLEDNLYLDQGEFASNLQLVERAVRIIRELGREPATPTEAAERLGITRQGAA